MVDVVSQLLIGGPTAQVHGLCPRVGGHVALFCIHRLNWVYSVLLVTLWTCYSALQIVVLLLFLSYGKQYECTMDQKL